MLLKKVSHFPRQSITSSADSWNSFLEIVSLPEFLCLYYLSPSYLNSACEQGPRLYLLSHAHQPLSSSINV